MQHQRVARAQADRAQVVAINMIAARHREYRNAVALAQTQFAHRLLEEARTRRNHRFGNTRARRVEQFAQLAHARRQLAKLIIGEAIEFLARPQHAKNRADPDHLIGRRRHACFVAALDGQDQRRAVQLLHLADAHAYQRAFRGYGEFGGFTDDAVGFGKVAFGTAGRDFLALVFALRQQLVGEQIEEQHAGDRQARDRQASR